MEFNADELKKAHPLFYRRGWRQTQALQHPIIAHNPGLVQMDLMDVSRMVAGNSGIRYLLCLIDVYSRYAWVFPLRDKTAARVVACLPVVKKELEDAGHMLESITSDRGSEFKASVNKWIEDHNIELFQGRVGWKDTTGIVERFNRTLRQLIGQYQVVKNTTKYIGALPDLVRIYNNRVNRTIGCSPKEALLGFQQAKQRKDTVPPDICIGDYVRILLLKPKFAKANEPLWSSEIYRVYAQDLRHFYLESSDGNKQQTGYTRYHLQKVGKGEINSDFNQLQKESRSESRAENALRRELAQLA